MPAKSAKQQAYMGMCSTPKGRAKAKGKCPPVAVAKEFARKPAGGYEHMPANVVHHKE